MSQTQEGFGYQNRWTPSFLRDEPTEKDIRELTQQVTKYIFRENIREKDLATLSISAYGPYLAKVRPEWSAALKNEEVFLDRKLKMIECLQKVHEDVIGNKLIRALMKAAREEKLTETKKLIVNGVVLKEQPEVNDKTSILKPVMASEEESEEEEPFDNRKSSPKPPSQLQEVSEISFGLRNSSPWAVGSNRLTQINHMKNAPDEAAAKKKRQKYPMTPSYPKPKRLLGQKRVLPSTRQITLKTLIKNPKPVPGQRGRPRKYEEVQRIEYQIPPYEGRPEQPCISSTKKSSSRRKKQLERASMPNQKSLSHCSRSPRTTRILKRRKRIQKSRASLVSMISRSKSRIQQQQAKMQSEDEPDQKKSKQPASSPLTKRLASRRRESSSEELEDIEEGDKAELEVGAFRGTRQQVRKRTGELDSRSPTTTRNASSATLNNRSPKNPLIIIKEESVSSDEEQEEEPKALTDEDEEENEAPTPEEPPAELALPQQTLPQQALPQQALPEQTLPPQAPPMPDVPIPPNPFGGLNPEYGQVFCRIMSAHSELIESAKAYQASRRKWEALEKEMPFLKSPDGLCQQILNG